MEYIIKSTRSNDLDEILSLYKDAAIWLMNNSIRQWDHFINPNDGIINWIKNGIENKEIHLIINKNKNTVAFYKNSVIHACYIN